MIISWYCLIKINFFTVIELLTYIIVNELYFPLGCSFELLRALGFVLNP